MCMCGHLGASDRTLTITITAAVSLSSEMMMTLMMIYLPVLIVYHIFLLFGGQKSTSLLHEMNGIINKISRVIHIYINTYLCEHICSHAHMPPNIYHKYSLVLSGHDVYDIDITYINIWCMRIHEQNNVPFGYEEDKTTQ